MPNFESDDFQELQDSVAKSMTPEAVEAAQKVVAMMSSVVHEDFDTYQQIAEEVRGDDEAFDCLASFCFSTITIMGALTGKSPGEVLEDIGTSFAVLHSLSQKYHQ